MKNAINWFEIPVSDFDRAYKFYSDIFKEQLHKEEMGNYKMGFLPAKEGVSGAIVHGEGYTPSDKGALLYLNGGDDLNNILERVETAGGKVLTPKRIITEEIGYMGEFLDTEGNKIALHSNK